ncbi:MAG: hypothetical protein J0L92_19075 [Deltaproteobacteria bacterium]|nr:hypothetical protein [Deltaproteobacteria bacterium]
MSERHFTITGGLRARLRHLQVRFSINKRVRRTEYGSGDGAVATKQMYFMNHLASPPEAGPDAATARVSYGATRVVATIPASFFSADRETFRFYLVTHVSAEVPDRRRGFSVLVTPVPTSTFAPKLVPEFGPATRFDVRLRRSVVLEAQVDKEKEDVGNVTKTIATPVLLRGKSHLQPGWSGTARVAFVAVDGLKSIASAPSVASVLETLHRVLGDVMGRFAWIQPALVGAIVVIPDAWGPASLDGLADQLVKQAADVGLELAVALAAGRVKFVADVDGSHSFIAPCINIAARMAYSMRGSDCLAHVSYLSHVRDLLAASHWLNAYPDQVNVAGKDHDPVFECFRRPRLPGLQKVAFVPESARIPEPSFCTLIAYDLSGFSKGDGSEIDRRFDAMSNVFAGLKANFQEAFSDVRLAPGGDGGILALSLAPDKGFALAQTLDQRSRAAATDVTESLTPALRVGVHFGIVCEYEDAQGVIRPAGPSMFVADTVTSDAGAREPGAVVLTHSVVDVWSAGNSAFVKEELDELNPISGYPNLKRFVRKRK